MLSTTTIHHSCTAYRLIASASRSGLRCRTSRRRLTHLCSPPTSLIAPTTSHCSTTFSDLRPSASSVFFRILLIMTRPRIVRLCSDFFGIKGFGYLFMYFTFGLPLKPQSNDLLEFPAPSGATRASRTSTLSLLDEPLATGARRLEYLVLVQLSLTSSARRRT